MLNMKIKKNKKLKKKSHYRIHDLGITLWNPKITLLTSLYFSHYRIHTAKSNSS
jgi:hypothetical protein